MAQRKRALENTVGERENAGNQHFLFFFSPVFSNLSKREIIILTSNLLSANTFNLDLSEILLFGKEFNSNFIMLLSLTFNTLPNNTIFYWTNC